MHSSPLVWILAIALYLASLALFTAAQTSAGSTSAISASATVVIDGATSTFRPIFTVPSSAATGAAVLPNSRDPAAVDPQTVCPGYRGSNVVRTRNGLTATLTLAGQACNVYGTDIETLNLTVEYQSDSRLSVNIVPAVIDASNLTHYIIPDNYLYEPTTEHEAPLESLTNDLGFVWSNDPTFSFTIFRRSTGDILFTTEGTKLVFENQFIEFVSSLPENYNLYGLGETIHGFRLGNNFTKTMWSADSGNPVD